MNSLAKVSRGMALLLLIFVLVWSSKAERRKPTDDDRGIRTTFARQETSPVRIFESTFAIGQQEPSFLLRRVVIKNVKEVPVTGFELGWIIVYRDQRRKPEIHSQSSFTEITIQPKASVELGQPLSRDDVTDEYSLVPAIPEDANMKAVSFFIAKVRFVDGSEFQEDAEALATRESNQVFAAR